MERSGVIGKEDTIVLCALYRQLQKLNGRNNGAFTDVHPHVKSIRKYCYFSPGKLVLPAVKNIHKKNNSKRKRRIYIPLDLEF